MVETKRVRPTQGSPEPGEGHKGIPQFSLTVLQHKRSGLAARLKRQVIGYALPHVEHSSSPGNAVRKKSPLWDLFSEFLKYTVCRAAILAALQKFVYSLAFKACSALQQSR